MRPTGAGADLGPAPGPRITCLRSVGPNLPATPVGASSRSGRLRSPSGPDRSGSIRRSHPGRGFPSAAPYSRWGAASGFPARWNPPPIPDTESLGLGALARSRAPCARSTHRLLGAGLAAMSSADRSSGPGPYRLAPYRSGRFQKRCSPRTIDIMGPEAGLVNPKREIPSPFPRIGEKSPPGPWVSTPLSTSAAPLDHHPAASQQPRPAITRRPHPRPARLSPGGHTRGRLGYHPAAGQQPRSIITRRRVSGRSVMIPSTPKSKRRCISPGSSMVQT